MGRINIRFPGKDRAGLGERRLRLLGYLSGRATAAVVRTMPL